MTVWGRKKARPVHEKDMGSYELFAWRDALALADFLDDTFGAARARRTFEEASQAEILEFESANGSLIGDFIQKPESQRPALLARLRKAADERTLILFVTLALLGVLRAKAVMELRDRFRTELAPGRGNRVTTAAVYDFSREMREVYRYAWPSEAFEALGIDDSDEDSDDD